MDGDHARELLAGARVARFATLTPDGAPHLVPVTFALVGDTLVHAVDDKPKATRRLARLRHLEHDPRAALLADHYAEDWSRLWWVRADGRARAVDAGTPEGERALDALAARYAPYRRARPAGPVIVLDIERLSGWEPT